MRWLHLVRRKDVSGCSGVGVVAQGVAFDDGPIVMRWAKGKADASSTGFYTSIAVVDSIHGHQGCTRIEWIDELKPIK